MIGKVGAHLAPERLQEKGSRGFRPDMRKNRKMEHVQ